MGVAFAAVVNSFVDNLVMPVVAMLIGKPDFRDLTFTINDAVFRYGAFITDVIPFVAIAARGVLLRRQADRGNDGAGVAAPVEEGMPDEERRHQELLARSAGLALALGGSCERARSSRSSRKTKRTASKRASSSCAARRRATGAASSGG